MTATVTTAVAPKGALHIGLWITQGLLALAFLGAGWMKLSTPYETLAAQMRWVADAPSFLPMFIGASEVAGALGLILPSALRIRPRLTPIAAALLAVVMVLAAVTHLMYGEASMLMPNIVLGGLAAFIAWGRAVAAPIPAKGS